MSTTAERKIRARRVRFDLSETPLHWVPGDARTTHTINTLHLVLPAGERWFCEVYRQAVPLIGDDAPELRGDVLGFIGQEATHARAHDVGVEYLASHDIDCTPYTRRLERFIQIALGDRPFGISLPRPLRRRWLIRRLELIAAIELFTFVLGQWVIRADALDRAGADPTMLDMLRWHGAEEVEHRSVAFDLARHLGSGHAGRCLAMIPVSIALVVLLFTAHRFCMRHDPTLSKRDSRVSARAFLAAGRAGTLPRLREMLPAMRRYLARDHHPSQEGSTEEALAYLASSPAAVAAKAA